MLSDAKIKSLKTEDGKRHKDRDGLVLEIRKSGKKVFLFRFQWNKKPQTITIGQYPSLSLKEARELVLNYKDMLNRKLDPRNNDAEKIESLLFKEVGDRWLQKIKHSLKEVTYNRHKKSLERDVYPYIGNTSINDITKAKILELIYPHELKGHHEVAHRLHDRLEAIFEFAVGASLTENYPFIGLKKALAPKPRVTNQPSVKPIDAHQLLDDIQNSKVHRINKIYVELLAHLFTRPSELRLAQWNEFNLAESEWNIPANRMKMGISHWVPLSKRAMELLKELRMITGFTCYLFQSPTTRLPQPISETSARKLLHALGYKNKHTLHGFRALASTVLHEQSCFRTDAIEAQLAHKVQGVRGVYLRADFKQERRELMNWYSHWFVKINVQTNLKMEVI